MESIDTSNFIQISLGSIGDGNRVNRNVYCCIGERVRVAQEIALCKHVWKFGRFVTVCLMWKVKILSFVRSILIFLFFQTNSLG